MARAASGTERRAELTMHVEQAPGARTLVQIIDILRHDQQLAGPFRVEPRQRVMRSVRLYFSELGTPGVIECVNHGRIPRERFRRTDILDPVPLPQPIRTPKGGQTALGGNAGAGEDDDVLNIAHDRALADRAMSAKGRRGHSPPLSGVAERGPATVKAVNGDPRKARSGRHLDA
jgi:hypothetical protein